MSENPYQTPDADIEQPGAKGAFRLVGPRGVSVGNGWSWISGGFDFFKKSWLNWILTIIVWFILMLVANFVPIIGQIFVMLTTYVWIAGYMAGCRAQDEGKPFEISYLFAGFSHNTGKLILLSVAMAVISVIVMLIVMGPIALSLVMGDDAAASQSIETDPLGFLLPFLFVMLLMIPLAMAIWFAPALIILNNLSIPEALKMSFMGCLKNIVPFLIYGIIALILYILAVIPIGLGLLVLGPTMIASIYVSYKDIFIED
ncbi:BPSS1780 family membrane protein [Aliikangiella coralliicola]|uniref:Transmembrane protein n=1 Tax=Aliikangiella coralliicola TaxID=2592383 RepID=A0A545UJJ5_9GAMM|nr:BPSS1780 family membrane protein [Aliikangiella coralliicola]TQV89629.1 hypothetical protein FLL46_01740 [Aliikangiella coralliicola]